MAASEPPAEILILAKREKGPFSKLVGPGGRFENFSGDAR